MQQTQLYARNTRDRDCQKELEDFERKHSETFMYFLEEYEKWQGLKKRLKISET